MTGAEADAIILQRWNVIYDATEEEAYQHMADNDKRGTTKDNVQWIINKFKFRKTYDMPYLIDESNKADVVTGAKLFFSTKFKEQCIFFNVFIEKGYHVSKNKPGYIPNHTLDLIEGATGITSLIAPEQLTRLEYILLILPLLGLQHSQDCQSIPSINQECIEFLTSNRATLVKHFGSIAAA